MEVGLGAAGSKIGKDGGRRRGERFCVRSGCVIGGLSWGPGPFTAIPNFAGGDLFRGNRELAKKKEKGSVKDGRGLQGRRPQDSAGFARLGGIFWASSSVPFGGDS